MAFFKIIKKAFGFGNDVDDELLDDSPVQLSMPRVITDELPPHSVAEPVEITVDHAEVDKIFDHVVNVFNEALPDFLSHAVDPELQRKKLYDSLDDSIKSYLRQVSDETRRQCEAQWSAEQAEMRSEMAHLKAKAQEIEQQRFDIKQQQLSSDRQRRALTNKVQALENQVANYEAEREQFDLENKSLVNKLKVAAVHESEVQTLRDELTSARSEILALRNGASTAPDAESSSEDKETISKLKDEVADLHEQLDQAAEKDRIATEMLNGLQSKASSARSQLAERDKEIESLKEQLKEAQNVQAEIDQLNKQMELVEDIIGKRDRKIAKLKSTCESLRDENESLRTTISDNLKTYADTESTLRRRIAELEADPSTPIAPSDLINESIENNDEVTANQMTKISDSDLNEIDERFDHADWMRSDPPDTPSMRSGVNEADFGYQPPSRKHPRHDNEAQLSLF